MAQPGEASGSSASTSVPEAASVPSQKAIRAADRKLVRKVSQALARTKGLNSTRLIVRARSGDITLLGSVTDAGQIPIAVDAAQRVDGVKSVRNEIRVDEQRL
ncbi:MULTISPECIES: BON domain-containing protein [Paraburkholderia]|uniref:BON domain-containing protein n=2 Tax=Burkholderiaceae TaxID=119060 RepID=A0AAP5BM61_9BURK|nr:MULTISPECIES: BON domain-containing protein [Paraburkholderia]MCX4152052.1 BON domain-containing protein [Paraburkholderia madseniana]MCX4175623.1 BON domain-containing protein [Paraburkholderia madseniana]MDN7154980.1 BON domain-containing protein [Paraburkholderia sp. WS6]MDQ6413863.1 BON domain-containing protein [Paraburkholderia madseniana]MDQ6463619.1 BON domain-containing protein [Paraburkholderia madseniana]